jgi:hypothetical protein
MPVGTLVSGSIFYIDIYMDDFLGAFQIITGWWGHQPGQTTVVGVTTDHSFKMGATIWNAPDFLTQTSLSQEIINLQSNKHIRAPVPYLQPKHLMEQFVFPVICRKPSLFLQQLDPYSYFVQQ